MYLYAPLSVSCKLLSVVVIDVTSSRRDHISPVGSAVVCSCCVKRGALMYGRTDPVLDEGVGMGECEPASRLRVELSRLSGSGAGWVKTV